ncbi:MAG TPA: cyclic nucleotide-binding domain-containing protein [Candidatus Limnocylindrales bacterium]|nr:cyclic nucleotide-binding domain-containing protein [Candidatus Limnocylindrales bacterium]
MTTIRSTRLSIDGLPPAVLARLDDLALGLEFGQGDVILREGSQVPFLGLIEVGRVALRLNVPGRGSRTIVTVEPGELLGWSAIVPPYRATSEAVAVTQTRLVAYDALALRGRLATDCELAAALLPVVLSGVSDRLTTSWHQLLDLFAQGSTEPW